MVINEKVDTNRRGFLKSVAAMTLAPALPALPILPAPLAAAIDPRAERRREALDLLRGQPAGGLSWDEAWRLYEEFARIGYPDVWFGIGHPDLAVRVIHVEGPDGEIAIPDPGSGP